MYPYVPHTQKDVEEMLKKLGLKNIEELFNDIPEDVKLNRELNLPKAKSELEVRNRLMELANKNCSVSKMTSYLGAGAYEHYIPSVVNHIISRSEFYTAYTPYQPEISQGTLQYIFEFQTLISELTGMDVANASLYDGGTAVVEAALMSCAYSKRDNIIISKTVKPDARKILKTYAHAQNLNVIEVGIDDGVTDLDELSNLVNENTAAVIVQSPNFFGIIEDLEKMSEIVHKVKKTTFVASVDPISLGILKRPGDLGVDVVVGEGQSLGIPLSFGGPYLGFMAAKKEYIRKMPGRIVGQTEDMDGKRSFVLTLTAREQHIRREKATSNICSNQGLNSLAATVYMVTLGKKGIREVALKSTQMAHYAYEELTKSGKVKPLFNKPFFIEFALKTDKPTEEINQRLLENGIIGGYDLSKEYPQYENSSLYAVTEVRKKEEIDKLKSVLEGIL